jgi:hypothetical protein
MAETLAFRHAEMLVKGYNDEADDLQSKHNEAMECRDCEDFLQLGIDAFDWLMRADTSIRTRVFRGEVPYTKEIDEALWTLLETWRTPCDFALTWAEKQKKRGFHVENLVEFQKCCREVADMLTPDDQFFSHDSLVALRDEALDEHAEGKTVEFGPT